ncbi:MAG TPA: MmgE/PrpD family protein [Candidatus Acidoferrales bacterium]|nr:MmgE/PrpD family protein [Candidatus Acidoferrales bacterium]
MAVTERIAEFVVATRCDTVPREALAVAKTAFLDCLGVALAGSKEDSAKICGAIARLESGAEQAAVLGQGFKSSALHAAFANGTAAHALDYDHSFALMGQPTAPIIPAVMSLGDALGASGAAALEAYVCGFEVTGKLALALRESTQDWHAPGTLGSIGATAACAKLLGLDARKIALALGMASSMASGVPANFGTMTKPLHVGLAARNGVLAAELAQVGYTANARALEAKGGFFDTFYAVEPQEDGPLGELGFKYALVHPGIKIKPYPCGGLTHTAIDAVLDMRARHGITGSAVESIEVLVPEHTYKRIAFKVPETGLQGKFSMGYILARALIDGRVGLEAFTDAAVRDRKVLELAEKVSMARDPAMDFGGDGSRPAKVTIRLKNGASFSRHVVHPKGSAESPLSEQELTAKFVECARRALEEPAIGQVIESVKRFETLGDIRPLCEFLIGER